jgi:hypothetical protein
MTSTDFHGGQSGTGAGFSPIFFCFIRFVFIPPLLHFIYHRPPPPQAAQYHIRSLEVGVFIFYPELGWLWYCLRHLVF